MRGTGLDWENRNVVAEHRVRQTKLARLIGSLCSNGALVKQARPAAIRGESRGSPAPRDCAPLQAIGQWSSPRWPSHRWPSHAGAGWPWFDVSRSFVIVTLTFLRR